MLRAGIAAPVGGDAPPLASPGSVRALVRQRIMLCYTTSSGRTGIFSVQMVNNQDSTIDNWPRKGETVSNALTVLDKYEICKKKARRKTYPWAREVGDEMDNWKKKNSEGRSEERRVGKECW